MDSGLPVRAGCVVHWCASSVIGIRTESPEDYPWVHDVVSRAFGREDEAQLVQALREDGCLFLALVAEAHGQLIGHVAFSSLPLESESGTIIAAALAPMAVAPDWQRKGVGSALIHRGLTMCRERKVPAVVVLGEPRYYSRFGFTATAALKLVAPFSGEAFQALELTPGALSDLGWARVRYPKPFGVD